MWLIVWHMTTLSNYLNLTVSNVPSLDVAGTDLKGFGQGSGMLGLQGDFTPPSPFVRAVAFSKSALPVETAREGVLQAFHILNVLGQTHFIKCVEDIHEALVSAVPGIKFGLAFREASGKCLIRWSGTEGSMVELARKNAGAIGAGHSFSTVSVRAE